MRILLVQLPIVQIALLLLCRANFRSSTAYLPTHSYVKAVFAPGQESVMNWAYSVLSLYRRSRIGRGPIGYFSRIYLTAVRSSHRLDQFLYHAPFRARLFRTPYYLCSTPYCRPKIRDRLLANVSIARVQGYLESSLIHIMATLRSAEISPLFL